MKFEGILEVFKNKKGYITGVLKAWDNEAKEVKGKVYIDVNLPEDVTVEDGQTLTLDVHEGYINPTYIEGENAFTKLKFNVVKCDIKSVFPEKKIKKSSKRTDEKLPF